MCVSSIIPRIIYLNQTTTEDEAIVSESGNNSKAPHQRKDIGLHLNLKRFKIIQMYMIEMNLS